MNLQMLETRVRRHLLKYLPKLAAELRRTKQLETRIRSLAEAGVAEYKQAVAMGAAPHEAEEFALKAALPTPEPKAGPKWEADELAEKQREYRKNVAPTL